MIPPKFSPLSTLTTPFVVSFFLVCRSKACYTTVNDGLRRSASFDSSQKAEGDLIKKQWKLFISHLTTSVSELKGTTGVHYRGQEFVSDDMQVWDLEV